MPPREAVLCNPKRERGRGSLSFEFFGAPALAEASGYNVRRTPGSQARWEFVLAESPRGNRLAAMKTLTLELDEKTYEAVQAQASRTGRSEAEVVSAALAPLRQLKELTDQSRTGHSLRDFKPLGIHLKPGALDFDDILGEMIDDSDRD